VQVDVVIKIAGWVIFILAFAGWVFAADRLQKHITQRMKVGQSTFWFSQMQSLLGVVGLFGFIFLLTGFLNLQLVALFLVAAEGGVIFSAMASPLLKTPQATSARLIYWVSIENATRHPWFTVVPFGIAFVAALLYPVVASVMYFTSSADDRSLDVVRLTLVFLGVSGYVFILPTRVAILVSPYLDEDSRTRVLVGGAGGLVSTALFLGLGYWAFGVHGRDLGTAGSAVPVTFSVELILVVVALFVVSVLIPYAIGVRVGRGHRLEYFDRQKHWLNESAGTLRVLGGATYAAELDALHERLQQEQVQLLDEFPAIEFAEVVPDDPDNNWEMMRASYDVALDVDPRLTYVQAVRKLANEVAGIASELAKRRSRDARDKLAENWSQVLRDRRDEIELHVQRTSQGISKAGLTVALGTAMISPVVEEVTKWAWQNMSQALPT
jgi:hypothetical protein